MSSHCRLDYRRFFFDFRFLLFATIEGMSFSHRNKGKERKQSPWLHFTQCETALTFRATKRKEMEIEFVRN